MSVAGYWYVVFAFMFCDFSSYVSEIYWVGFSLLSSINGRYNVGSGNIFVTKGTVNL